MPVLTIVAGANGAGKSTFTKNFPKDVLLIDPDAIAREIDPVDPVSAAIPAGRQALKLAKAYIESDRSFTVETTFAGKTYLNLIGDAKDRNWQVELTYIGINNSNINISRVESRVELGGHDVPKADIIRRYERSLTNLVKAAKMVDLLTLYDNSTKVGHILIARIESDRTSIYQQNLPQWLERLNIL
jgi:predicted ABC-type ATPase